MMKKKYQKFFILTIFKKTISKAQLELIFEKSKYFPNSSELSIAFINGDSVNYYGVIRQNDSIIYINNSQHIFER